MAWGYLSRKKVYIFLKFKIIKAQIFDVENEVVARQLVRQVVYTMLISNNRASFRLW